LTSTRKSSRASNHRQADGQGGEEKQVILGIDPGSIVTGYGVISIENGETVVVKWGVIRARKADPLPKRLHTIYRNLIELIETVLPDCVAVECAFYGSNVKSLIAMGQSVGIILLASAEKGLDAFQYTPREVKKSVVGTGGASKEQVQRMIFTILSLKPSDVPLDATDALAVAMCHENRMRLLSITSR